MNAGDVPREPEPTIADRMAWLIANQFLEGLSDDEIKAAPHALREAEFDGGIEVRAW